MYYLPKHGEHQGAFQSSVSPNCKVGEVSIYGNRPVQASLVAQMVKNLPAVQKTWLRSLGREDPLEEGMATHSSILAWRISWTEEPGGLPSMGSERVRHDCVTKHALMESSSYLGR